MQLVKKWFMIEIVQFPHFSANSNFLAKFKIAVILGDATAPLGTGSVTVI